MLQRRSVIFERQDRIYIKNVVHDNEWRSDFIYKIINAKRINPKGSVPEISPKNGY